MNGSPGDRLRRRWDGLWSRFGVPAGRVPAFEYVCSAYSAAGRHYHDLNHIAACLDELDGVRDFCREPDAVEAALWYHDIVYDPRRSDNEERSAAVASRAMLDAGMTGEFVASVGSLILATRHTSPTVGPDEELIADIDLAILGKPQEMFDAYERAIRREYAHVSDRDFTAGRAGLLRGLLVRPRIYATETFARRYEEAARRNLHRSVAGWEARLVEPQPESRA